MKNSQLIYVAAMVVALGTWGCSDSSGPMTAPDVSEPSAGMPVTLYLEEPCGDQMETGLVTRNQELVGFVTVANDQQILQVTLDVRGLGWVLAKSNLTLARPQAPSGAGRLKTLNRGRYNFSERHDPPVTLYDFDIDLAEIGLSAGEPVDVAVHVVVQMLDEGGNPIATERAWALPPEESRPQSSLFMRYVVQDCEEGPDPCALTVQYPNGGEFFCAGWEVDLQWDGSLCGADVKIELLWDGSPCSTIAEAAPNTGSYTWLTAPCNWETSGYAIRVTDLESGVYDDSDGTFVFGECGGE